jgi:hypothetical protein
MKRSKEIKSFAMSKYKVSSKNDSNYKEYKAFIDGCKYADRHPKNLWRDAKTDPPKNSEYDWVLGQIQEDNGYLWIPRVIEYRENTNDWIIPELGSLNDITKLEGKEVFKVIRWMPIPVDDTILNKK